MMVAPAAAAPRADAIEQACAVGREDRDPGRSAVRLMLRNDCWALASPICASAAATWRALASCHVGRLRRANSCREAGGHGRARSSASSPAPRRAAAWRWATISLRPRCLWPSRSRSSAASNKCPKQLPLPVVPDAGADRANVDHGQHQQQPQPLRALHVRDEVLDRLGIGEVALERGLRQQQMIANQPGDRLGLGLVEPEAAGKAPARPRRPVRCGRRRGPWRCRAAAPRHRARGATRSA